MQRSGFDDKVRPQAVVLLETLIKHSFWIDVRHLTLLYVCVSGFTPGARELFKQENHLALYQLPSGEKTKEFTSRRLHYFTKRQPPISHLISLFVRDSSSSESTHTSVK